MPKLTNSQQKQLHEALRDSFKVDELKMMLLFQCNVNMEHITNDMGNAAVAFKVVQAAVREDWYDELIVAAHEARPKNKSFKSLAEQFTSPSSDSTAQTDIIQISIKGNVKNFKESALQIVLASMLDISTSDVVIESIRSGSVIVTLQLPKEAAEKLLQIAKNNPELLPSDFISVNHLGEIDLNRSTDEDTSNDQTSESTSNNSTQEPSSNFENINFETFVNSISSFASSLLGSAVLVGFLTLIISAVALLGLPSHDPPSPPEKTMTAQAIRTQIAYAKLTPTVTNTPTPTLTPTPTPTPTPLPTYETIDLAYESITQRRKVIVAISNEFSPFGDVSEDGTVSGFDVDIVREMAKRWFDLDSDENVDEYIEFKPVSTDERTGVLERGEVDFIAAAFTYTHERCGQVLCTEIYFQDGTKILVRNGSDIQGIEDLNGKMVGVQETTTAADDIREYEREYNTDNDRELSINLKFFPDKETLIEALLNGEIDAYVTDAIILEQIALNNDSLTVVGGVIQPAPYTMGVSLYNDGMVALINQTLQAMAHDGWYNEIYANYFDCEERRPYPIRVGDPDAFREYVKTNAQLSDPQCPVTEIETEIVVEPGDTLSGIAKEHYGDFEYYKCIQDENGIANLHVISVGSTLRLPPDEVCNKFMADR